MQPLIFNQSSIFHLQKLAHDVRSSTGIRHKLSDENSMMKLLKKATLSNNSNVRQDLDNFTSELDEKQLNTLMNHGVVLKQAINS